MNCSQHSRTDYFWSNIHAANIAVIQEDIMKKTIAIVMAVMLASLLFVFVQALRIHVAFNLPERIKR